ncbi:MAG TPA: glycosyltransferase family 9 protein [Pyrinomonadaceae bacterium]|jgi:lipopolysaccharide heptosyltransferase II|nr:glycosyltransferase family 9 protein [Pyrinomonadaceae bacterium]
MTVEELTITPQEISPAEALGPAQFDWSPVRRVLVVRLRSIGDTVLATPALYALRRFLPHAQIDILLEDWVAPLLENCADADRVISVARGSTLARLRLVPQLRAARYDVGFNLHGGTTAALLLRASGARHRVGYADYRYPILYNHHAPPAAELWDAPRTHSVEQQLALPGWLGVPVTDRPPTRLPRHARAEEVVEEKLAGAGLSAQPFALLHPAAAFASKQWAAENFARIAEHLETRGLRVVALAAHHEAALLGELQAETRIKLLTLTGLSLPEVTALARRARLFVGNDSGVAHIAAAVGAPSVVVFGSSNVAHWRPWATAPAVVVREEMPCAPCPGYTCAEYDAPECIRRVSVERVRGAVDKLL